MVLSEDVRAVEQAHGTAILGNGVDLIALGYLAPRPRHKVILDGDRFWILTGQQDDGTLYPNYNGCRVTYPSSTASVLSAHTAQVKAKSGRHS